ncbi:MAG: SPOR domain-containing protein [Methylophilaceae bacterium]|nr:SPOR domain-containing protein [Methylophilaceae bacterium]
MTKDYKQPPPKQKSAGKGSPFLAGLLVGLLLGIGLSIGVVVYVKQGDSPFQDKVASAPQITAPEPPSTKTVPANPPSAEVAAADKKENRFTFYGILTGSESPVSEQEIKQAEQQKLARDAGGEPPLHESYFLQVGAYQTEQEADNMKARLALLGLEAVVQTANIPDKGILHRVRVGPLANLDEINKARTELARNGFDADLIKIRNNVPDQ